MLPAMLLIGSALVLWIYSERTPASEVLSQLRKSDEFLVKRSSFNQTYLSCTFTKNDTGITRPQAIHRYAALSDIVYGNITTEDALKVEALLGLR